jgi:hypothetical protein
MSSLQVIPLHKSNGTELEFALRYHCKAVLPDNPKYRTMGKTSLGFRNFCKQQTKVPPEQSCLQQFRRRFS